MHPPAALLAVQYNHPVADSLAFKFAARIRKAIKRQFNYQIQHLIAISHTARFLVKTRFGFNFFLLNDVANSIQVISTPIFEIFEEHKPPHGKSRMIMPSSVVILQCTAQTSGCLASPLALIVKAHRVTQYPDIRLKLARLQLYFRHDELWPNLKTSSI